MRVIRFPFLSTDIQPVLLASSRHVCQILEVAGWSVSCCCELARHGPGDELFGGPAWSDGLGGGGDNIPSWEGEGTLPPRLLDVCIH